MVEWGSTLFPGGQEIVMDVIADFFFFITFLSVVSETGLNLLSGLPKVLCGWAIVTGSLQISRNISVVNAEQFF